MDHRSDDSEEPLAFEDGSPSGGWSAAGIAGVLRDRVRSSAFVRDVGRLWTAQAFVLVAGVVQGILVARWLGPRAFGVAGLVLGFPSLVYAFLDARASDASVRYLGEFATTSDLVRARAFCKLGYGVDLLVALATAAATAALAPWAAGHIVHRADAIGWIVAVGAGMVVSSPAGTSEAVLVTLARFRTLGILQAVSTMMRLVCVLVLVARGWGIGGVIWGTVASQAVQGIVMLVVASRVARDAWREPWWTSSIRSLAQRSREIARFIAWSDAGSLFGLASKQLDLILVGSFGGATAAGYYRLARSFGSIGGFLAGPLQSVLFQRFARLRSAGSAVDLASTVRRVARAVCFPLAIICLAVLPVVPAAVRALAGPRYAGATSAAQVLVALDAGWFLFLWVRPLALTLGEARLWALVSLGTAIASVLGFLAVTPSAGAVGTAWVRLAASVAAQSVPAVVMARRARTGAYEPPRIGEPQADRAG